MSAEVFGRDAELRTLTAFLDGLRIGPDALVVAGATGVGKTSLLRAGAALAAEYGFTVLHATPARSDLRLAFAGLADLLEPCQPAVIGELAPPQARALRVALRPGRIHTTAPPRLAELTPRTVTTESATEPHQRCFGRLGLVGLGGREPVAEG